VMFITIDLKIVSIKLKLKMFLTLLI